MGFLYSSDGGRKALQVSLAVLAAIPFASGIAAAVAGPRALPGGRSEVTASADSEYRFASTFWGSISVIIWSQLARVERDSPVLPSVMGVVFLGGLARLRSWQQRGRPHPVFVAAIMLELIGMPLFFAWQRKVVSKAKS